MSRKSIILTSLMILGMVSLVAGVDYAADTPKPLTVAESLTGPIPGGETPITPVTNLTLDIPELVVIGGNNGGNPDAFAENPNREIPGPPVDEVDPCTVYFDAVRQQVAALEEKLAAVLMPVPDPGLGASSSKQPSLAPSVPLPAPEPSMVASTVKLEPVDPVEVDGFICEDPELLTLISQKLKLEADLEKAQARKASPSPSPEPSLSPIPSATPDPQPVNPSPEPSESSPRDPVSSSSPDVPPPTDVPAPDATMTPEPAVSPST